LLLSASSADNTTNVSGLLCGLWAPLTAGKCTPAQTCCQTSPPNNPEACTLPYTAGSSTFVTQENYQFAFDGQYSVDFQLATGTCPIASGTLTADVITFGSYIDEGPNPNLGGSWRKLMYVAHLFQATLTKTNKAAYYTPGVNVGGVQVGPCQTLDIIFNNATSGCPCNETWMVAPFVNATYSPATRTINKTECVDDNGNSTCPEDFYFDISPRYGSYRVTDTSNTTRLLEITRPTYDNNTGYNDSTVYANFTANYTCPQSVNNGPPTTAPTAAPAASDSTLLFPSAALLLFSFLCM